MISGIDSSFSSGLTRGVQHAEDQRDEQQRPPAAAMIDAVDELNRDPQRRRVDQQSK